MMRAPFPCTTRERGDQYSNRRPVNPALTCIGGHNPLSASRGSGPCPEHRVAGGCSCGMIEGRFAELIAGQRQGVLVTLRKDGRPQLSNVNYAWYPEEQTIRVSTTDDRAKTGNMRRDPRVSFHVTSGDFWSYVVVDGHAELSEVARDPHDAAVEELVDLYRAVQGDHPEWDDYRSAMVRDRRLVLRLRAERAYGMVHRG
jgi:PPOX class probable F420-dependent enzyme